MGYCYSQYAHDHHGSLYERDIKEPHLAPSTTKTRGKGSTPEWRYQAACCKTSASYQRAFRLALHRGKHIIRVNSEYHWQCQPIVAAISVYTGFTFAMLFSFLGSYNYVFLFIYHFNSKEVGLTFLGIMIGFFNGIAIVGVCDKLFYQKALVRSQCHNPAPEARLPAAIIGSILLPISLFVSRVFLFHQTSANVPFSGLRGHHVQEYIG